MGAPDVQRCAPRTPAQKRPPGASPPLPQSDRILPPCRGGCATAAATAAATEREAGRCATAGAGEAAAADQVHARVTRAEACTDVV